MSSFINAMDYILLKINMEKIHILSMKKMLTIISILMLMKNHYLQKVTMSILLYIVIMMKKNFLKI